MLELRLHFKQKKKTQCKWQGGKADPAGEKTCITTANYLQLFEMIMSPTWISVLFLNVASHAVMEEVFK